MAVPFQRETDPQITRDGAGVGCLVAVAITPGSSASTTKAPSREMLDSNDRPRGPATQEQALVYVTINTDRPCPENRLSLPASFQV